MWPVLPLPLSHFQALYPARRGNGGLLCVTCMGGLICCMVPWLPVDMLLLCMLLLGMLLLCMLLLGMRMGMLPCAGTSGWWMNRSPSMCCVINRPRHCGWMLDVFMHCCMHHVVLRAPRRGSSTDMLCFNVLAVLPSNMPGCMHRTLCLVAPRLLGSTGTCMSSVYEARADLQSEEEAWLEGQTTAAGNSRRPSCIAQPHSQPVRGQTHLVSSSIQVSIMTVVALR